jgi:hypothetical protein
LFGSTHAISLAFVVLVGLIEAGDVPMGRGFQRWLAVVKQSGSLSNDLLLLLWLFIHRCH